MKCDTFEFSLASYRGCVVVLSGYPALQNEPDSRLPTKIQGDVEWRGLQIAMRSNTRDDPISEETPVGCVFPRNSFIHPSFLPDPRHATIYTRESLLNGDSV
jgi:hypothetical protein